MQYSRLGGGHTAYGFEDAASVIPSETSRRSLERAVYDYPKEVALSLPPLQLVIVPLTSQSTRSPIGHEP